ncbi:MAG TPA: O-antigen ligase family protein [Streptosporangiaceae bacterium]|nr:O-antigen ligase family protein [Streptosporangiaceae bacterium]
MSASVTLPRLRRDIPLLEGASADERWVRRRVTLTWCLLVLNVLTYYPSTWSGAPLLIHLPSAVGKIVTQGAMPAALLVALTVNRRLLIRPNAYLCIVTLLTLAAFMVMLEPGHVGAIYRTFRMAGFVATLWLLTPWWGRRDMLLVRSHLVALSIVLGLTVLGLLIRPHTALAEGRLEGAIWPDPPTQVAHYAAVMVGIVLLLWLCSLVSGRLAFIAVAVGVPILLLTHTRTALVAMLAGVLVGGISLFRARARVRKLFAALGVLTSLAAITLSGFLTTWLARGQSTSQLASFTGRTNVWSALLSAPRNEFQVIFGFGLSNLSFNGLSIDSNWLGSYLDLGLVGVVLTAVMLLFVLVSAYFRPLGPQRAIALFLVTYCLISSFTETGLSSPSLYFLELALAASLLVPSTSRGPS